MDECQRWKYRTECAFDGSGYERVLGDATYAFWNTQMSRVVYSQLGVATVGRTAHHLIKQHDDNKDEYGVWNALREWHDGGSVKNEIADYLRFKLEIYRLTSASKAAQYINNFLTSFREFKKILEKPFRKVMPCLCFWGGLRIQSLILQQKSRIMNIIITSCSLWLIFIKNRGGSQRKGIQRGNSGTKWGAFVKRVTAI